MKDPMTGCIYDRVYQDLKKFSKHGETFCKELMTVLQERADLEISYAKGLQKLASRFTKVSSNTIKSSIYKVWTCVSEEMIATAELHRKLGTAIQTEAIQPLSQLLDDQTKKKKPLENAVGKSAKLVTSNWNQQIKTKKRLMGCTKEHETLFQFVESTKQMATEKEKKKMLNRLKKSAKVLSQTDEEYYTINMTGHEVRLKWESTLQHCYQRIQEMEKERIQLLCDILNIYRQHVSRFGETLITAQKQIHQTVTMVDAERDIKTFLDETSVSSEETKTELLLVDYFEEDSRNGMNNERRKASILMKLHRLQNDASKVKRDKEGLERMTKAQRENPTFSDAKNQEDIARLLDETSLKLNLLEANFFKLTSTMAELEKKEKPSRPSYNNIYKWKDKDCHHSVVMISRPIRIRRLQTSTSSLNGSGDHHGYSVPHNSTLNLNNTGNLNLVGAEAAQDSYDLNMSDFDDKSEDDCQIDGANDQSIGACKALYDFQAKRDDELNLQAGDIIIIQQKDDEGWWYGTLQGKKGYFPSTYVEELPHFNINKTSEA
ncbi:nostrin [Latimeria chalumnae]|uniref:nostrin n=1 Tax=Latimeria chalumnae TaxID=7897 RepID=UPI0006D94036|nr:PREDICTED: nostrin [Latimeria chalumnae]|eukprot:XP_014347076.1 PREDICTED: nostrin [Latimeria chalumnae]